MIKRFRPALDRIGLPAWFIAIDLLWIAKPDVLGVDARHYQRATATWLAGGDPWSVTESGVTFASGPHTMLFYVPTSVLPLDVSVAFWLILGAAASVWLIKRLGLPIWWVLFPPLVHAMWNGNPQSVALALLVLGGPLAGAMAVGFKLYAAIPLLARPRLLVVAGIALAVTLPVLPWQLYIDGGFGVSDHIQTAWNGSAWRLPILIPPTLVALWILRRHGAEWLAVPAVWPATQLYYTAMALPALAEPTGERPPPNSIERRADEALPGAARPIMAAALALPAPLVAPLVVMALAGWTLWATRRDSHPSGSGTSAPSSTTR